MPRPRLITFDCYGTLIDWNAGIAGAFAAEAERQGEPVDNAAILTAYHAAEPRAQAGPYAGYRDVLTRLEAEVATELGWAPPASPGYLAESLPSWPVFADTNAALRRLAAAGYALGIVSNVDDDLLAGTRRHLEVAFDLLVTAQQVRSYKPATAHFERALQHVGGDRGALLHVAQSYFHDVRPALALGITTLWVNRLGEPDPGGAGAPAAIVADLAGATDYVLRPGAA